jgi:hypothetical protein
LSIPGISLRQFETGILYLDARALENAMANSGDFSTLLVPEAFAKLNHLAVDSNELPSEPGFFEWYKEPERVPILCQFTGLKMLSLVEEKFLDHSTWAGEDGELYCDGSDGGLYESSVDERILVNADNPEGKPRPMYD